KCRSRCGEGQELAKLARHYCVVQTLYHWYTKCAKSRATSPVLQRIGTPAHQIIGIISRKDRSVKVVPSTHSPPSYLALRLPAKILPASPSAGRPASGAACAGAVSPAGRR